MKSTHIPKLTIVKNSEDQFCFVSMAQHKMLQYVKDHPGCFYDEVALHIGFDVPSTTTYASRMAKAKLIVRGKKLMDNKRYKTHLTLLESVQLDFKVIRLS